MIPGFEAIDLGPGIFAGFTSRTGGISTPPYDELNLGSNVNDVPAHVAANRDLVAKSVGRPIAYANQIHSAQVIVIADAAPWYVGQKPSACGDADGLVTAAPVGLGVLVADCVPILLASDYGIAVAHAGRRGIELQVIAAVVAKLRELAQESLLSESGVVSTSDGGFRETAAGFGQRAANVHVSRAGSHPPKDEVRAAIGPAICGKCYEVPAQMQAEVCELFPAARSTTRWGTPGLDLPAAAASQLAALGIKSIYQSPVCTFEDHRYYSHRRATAKGETTGRQAGIIVRADSTKQQPCK